MKKSTLLEVFLPVLFIACTPAIPDYLEPHEIIPASSAAVLKINDPEQFRSNYRNSPILKSLLGSDKEENAWQRSLENVLGLDVPSGALLVFGSGTASGEWLMVLPDSGEPVDSTQAEAGSMANVPPPDMGDSVGVHFKVHHNLRVMASSGPYMAEILKEPDPSPGIEKALKAVNPLAEASLILPPPLKAVMEGSSEEATAEGIAWTTYDLSTGTGFLGLERMEAWQDSTAVLSRLLRSQPVLPLQDAASFIPASTTTWLSYSLQSPDPFREAQKTVTGNVNPNSQILENAEQLSLVETDLGVLVVLHHANAASLEESLMPLRGASSEFQDTQIYSLQKNGDLRKTYAPLLDAVQDPAYYCALGDAFVFSASLEPLRSLISDYNRKAGFDKTPAFEYMNPVLASDASALLLSLDPEASNLLKDPSTFDMLPPQLKTAIPRGYATATQLNLENEYTLGSYQLLSPSNFKKERPEVGEVFTAALDGAVQTPPQFLVNHRDGSMDIAVQDENHVLYLFSNSGTLFWKKELPGPIQGRIHQVDLFRNGRLQMAFSTDSQLMVLDRNGKEVAPFPKKFPGGNLGPLAVFDYEQNRNYRLVVCQGPKVFMFDGQGRDVKGFKFRNAGKPVVNTPVHIRIGSRDYLVFQLENGELKILNRVGDPRVPVRETFAFSSNPVYLYRNGFSFTERTGDLVRVDTRGRVNRTPLNLSPDHGMDATSKTLTLMDDNRFQVKTNKRELELGVYTHPKIFYLYDIIYVAVTDIQSQQVYLFRSTGADVPGFPLEGVGPADMADMDNDRNPELVVPFRENNIRVYRVNR